MAFRQYFSDPDFVAKYPLIGPPAFTPGHSGLLQMSGVLLAERVPETGAVLVVGAGGGLDTKALAKAGPKWHFVGVDPSEQMLGLARSIIGPETMNRVELINGVVKDAPKGPFDAATIICVLGILPDDGTKLTTLKETRSRMKPGAPLVMVDQCYDITAPDFGKRLDRYAAYAVASGLEPAMVENARKNMEACTTTVTAQRDEELLAEAGFTGVEAFYMGFAWRGWVCYA